MTDRQVVVNTAECEFPRERPCVPPTSAVPVRWCYGCLGDGRRALLDTAREVELCDLAEADISGAEVVWVAVEVEP